MNFKEKTKKILLSTFFTGTYREYTELKQRQAICNNFKENDEKEKETLRKELTKIQITNNELKENLEKINSEKEKINSDLDNKEQEIKRVYEGHQGLEDEINFLKYRNETLINLHDETVRKQWNTDKNLTQYVCLRPFENIEILSRGEVYTCCSAFVKHNHYIGNIYNDEFEDIWNSKKARQLRYSVSKGNFEYCNSFCRELKIGVVDKPEYYLKYRKNYKLSYKSNDDCKLKVYPKQITLTCDESCNLYCVSCRNKKKVLDKEESERLYRTLVNKVLPLMKNCEQLSLLGSGDFFMSQACMNFIKHITYEDFPQLSLYIVTNAQLFNEKNWNKFENLNDVPVKVAISIDASNKECYEKLRRGANWEILLQNLEYIKNLKKIGNIISIRFNFVVQLENYRDMDEFVKLAEKYDVDEIWFQRIANWGTISQNEFLKVDVFNPDNINFNVASNLLLKVKNNKKITILENCL